MTEVKDVLLSIDIHRNLADIYVFCSSWPLGKHEFTLRLGSDAGIVSVWKFWRRFFVLWWNTFSTDLRQKWSSGTEENQRWCIFILGDGFFYFCLCLQHFMTCRLVIVKRQFPLPSHTIRAEPCWKWALFHLVSSRRSNFILGNNCEACFFIL